MVLMKTPDKARVGEIRREIQGLMELNEQYAKSKSHGGMERAEYEACRQRLLELKLELSQMMRRAA
jgi:hypothetical protein